MKSVVFIEISCMLRLNIKQVKEINGLYKCINNKKFRICPSTLLFLVQREKTEGQRSLNSLSSLLSLFIVYNICSLRSVQLNVSCYVYIILYGIVLKCIPRIFLNYQDLFIGIQKFVFLRQ